MGALFSIPAMIFRGYEFHIGPGYFFKRIPESLLNELVNHLKKDRHILPTFKKDMYGF
jgi:hypothetical protein